VNSNDAEVAAGEWLARLDRDDPDPADLAIFERWEAADPRHAAAFARLAATWQALDRVQAIRPRSDKPINNDYINSAMQQSAPNPEKSLQPSLRESLRHRPPQPSVYRPWVLFSVAASILVAFAGFWIAHTSGGPQIFSTSIGGFQRIVLDDQSAIELNTDSEVRVALSPGMRKVELARGEASFEVTHDPSRPFIVSAGTTAVRAVGTKFDVRRLESSVEVTVDEGKVLVGAPEMLETPRTVVAPTMLRLSAGQTALSSGSGVKIETLAKDSIARKLAWQNQMLVFDGDSLADVVAQFNRYNERQLVIADPSLTTLQIGGYFRPTHLDAFISVLQSDFGIRVNTDGNRLVLATATTYY
jgi:transmembrane sensor